MTNLEYARKFYRTYKDRIPQTLFEKFAIKKNQTVFGELEKKMPFTLPWSHYLQLMRIKDDNERSFYEIEAASGNWSLRTLQRQYNSSYYERLALSRDKDGVKALAIEGNQIAKPTDIIKQPIYSDVVDKFIKAVYAFEKANPDYELTNYLETMSANGIRHLNTIEPDGLDAKVVMAALMAIVRQERFCDGLILSCLENGTVQKLIRRLKEIDENGDTEKESGM